MIYLFFPFWKILHICSTAAAIRMPESIRIQAAWFTVPMSYYIFQGMSLMPTVLSRTMSRNSNIGAEESKSRYPLSTLFGLSSDLYRITQWPRSAPKRCRILARFQWAKTSHNLFVRSSSSPSSVLTKCYTKYLIYHGKCQRIKSNFVLCCFCRVVFCPTFVQEDVNGGPGCPQH